MNDDISQLGRYRIDSEVGRLRAEIERLNAREARLLDVLRGLIECCEYTRDSAFHDKSKYVNSVSQSAWSSFCLQVRVARAALAGEEKKS